MNRPAERYLYIIGCPPGCKKIGLATDPHTRMEALQKGNPHRLRLNYACKVPAVVAVVAERIVHRALAPYRLHGEWFKLPTLQLARFAIADALRAVDGIAEEMRERHWETLEEWKFYNKHVWTERGLHTLPHRFGM